MHKSNFNRNIILLWSILWWCSHYKILHMSWQHCCHVMCKILQWTDIQELNFSKILQMVSKLFSIEFEFEVDIHLVKWADAWEVSFPYLQLDCDGSYKMYCTILSTRYWQWNGNEYVPYECLSKLITVNVIYHAGHMPVLNTPNCVPMYTIHISLKCQVDNFIHDISS